MQKSRTEFQALFQFTGLIGSVLVVDVDPNGPRKAEVPYKKDRTDQYEQPKATVDTHPDTPDEKSDETETKPAGDDIGNEHCTIVVPRFWHKILATVLAAVVHFGRILKRPGAGFE